MIRTEQDAKISSRLTGSFATLHVLLGDKGSDAPSIDGTRAPSRRLRSRLALLAIAALSVVAMALPAAAPAAPHDLLYSFGPDGTAATAFSTAGSNQGGPRLVFQAAARRLYVLDSKAQGIYGFDASAPPAYPPLAGFAPLLTGGSSTAFPMLAVDNTTLASAGNLYFTTSLGGGNVAIKGVDSGAVPLPGFWPSNPSCAQSETANGGGLAVDSAGRIWAARSIFGDAQIFDSACALLEEIEPGAAPLALAFDSNDDFYLRALSSVLKYTAAAGYEEPTTVDPGSSREIAVDTKNHHFYVVDDDNVKEYNGAGDLLDTFAEIPGAAFSGIAVDPVTHYVYVADHSIGQIRVFDAGEPAPSLTLEDPDPLANTAATLKGSVGPEGLTVSECRFDYVTEAAFKAGGFSDLSSGGSAPCEGAIPADNADHPVSADLTGLTTNTTYFYRIAVTIGATEHSFQESFITPGSPSVETTGSPVPTPTSAVLSGRVNPQGEDTTYHFEYGLTDSYGSITPDQPAGAGREVELVAQRVTGLSPDTTYHYRLVADNGNPDGPSVGQDMTLTTHPAQPLTNESFPHPPGSDRAYEQITTPDTGGNPVLLAQAFSDDGNRAIYQISGGAPISETGTFFSNLFAERVETAPHVGGWQSSTVNPFSLTQQGTAQDWFFAPAADLSQVIGYNVDGIAGSPPGPTDAGNLWRIVRPAGPHTLLNSALGRRASGFYQTSEDAGRVVAAVRDSLDPANPVDPTRFHLYDVSDASPELLSFLPGGGVPGCGMAIAESGSSSDIYRFGINTGHAGTKRGWVSDDGARAFFFSDGDAPCPASPGAEAQLYVRDIAAGVTTPVSLLPGAGTVSGPTCPAAFLRATDTAAFFVTQSRLDDKDADPGACVLRASNFDVYRYDLSDESLRCLTCLGAGIEADVIVRPSGYSALTDVGVSAEGSAVYFASPHRLLDGAAKRGIYRLDVGAALADVGEDALAYVGPSEALGTPVGDELGASSAVSADGSVLVFKSKEPGLDPLGDGTTNAGTVQYYRYDHTDRSLVCVSCPPEGATPRAAVGGNSTAGELTNFGTFNGSVLSADGDVLAFDSPNPLTAADQNTPAAGQNPYGGQDVYEWREGRALLITDGLKTRPSTSPTDTSHVEAPSPFGVSATGRDVFFTVAAQYTPDAPDGYSRLYTARLGGGFSFPEEVPPCPLEVCQGTPRGAPQRTTRGSTTYSGPGNVTHVPRRRCPKGKRKVRRGGKVRCVPRHRKPANRRANHDRRAAR